MRIAILCPAALDTFQQEVLRHIIEDDNIKIAAAFIDCRPRPSVGRRFFKNLHRRRGGYMAVMLFQRLFAKRCSSMAATEFCSRVGIDCIETRRPYCDEEMERLRTLGVDTLVMVGGFGIVKEPLLSLAPGGILSYHHGDMRKYRGQPVGFWELYHGETEMGITVQRLGADIDKGIPIVEKRIPITRNDTVRSLREKTLEQSTEMMHDALRRVMEPGGVPVVIDCYGPLYTLPNLRQYLLLQLKLVSRKK